MSSNFSGSNQTIVEYLVRDSSTETLKQIEEGHKKAANAVDQSANAAKKSQGAHEGLGSSLGSVRSGIVGLSAGAFLGEEAMTSLGSGAMKSATGLEAARSAMHLFALAIIDPTPLGLAAVTIGVLVGMMQAQQKQQETMLKPSQDLQKSIDDLKSAHTTLGKQIQAVTGLSGSEADAWASAATKSDAVAKAIRDQAKAREELIKASQPDILTQGLANTLGLEFLGMREKLNAQSAQTAEALRWQALADHYANSETAKKVELVNEQNRVLGILTPNIVKLNEEYAKEQTALKDLAAAHNKNITKLNEEAEITRKDSMEKQGKLVDDTAKKETTTWENYYKQLAALDYSYAQSLQAQMHQLGLVNRDEQRQMAQYAIERAKSLQQADENLGIALRDLHTDREREKAQLTALIDKRNIEQQYAVRIQDMAQKKADRDAEFAYQKQLVDEQYSHNKQLAIESRDAQIEAAKISAREQSIAITDMLNKSIAAIDKRKAEETIAYTESIAKEKARYQEQIKNLTDVRTEEQKINDVIIARGKIRDADIQRAIDQFQMLKNAATWGGASGSVSIGQGGRGSVSLGSDTSGYSGGVSGSINMSGFAEQLIGSIANALSTAIQQKLAREFLR